MLPFENQSNVFRDTLLTIGNAFDIAVDNGDSETFLVLNSFLYRCLSDAARSDNYGMYESYSTLFVRYYRLSQRKLKSSAAYKDIYDLCSDRAPRGLKEKIIYGFPTVPNKVRSIDQQRRINKFSRILLDRFAEVIELCLRQADLQKLPFILNELNQCSTSFDRRAYSRRAHMALLRAEASPSTTSDVLKQLKDDYEVETYVPNTVRQLFKVTFFWSVFLYSTEFYGKGEVSRVIQIFDEYQGHIQRDFIDDVLALLSAGFEEQYAWTRWDHEQRMSGKTYTPVNPDQWILLGSIIYLLKVGADINFDIRNKTRKQIKSLEYALDSMLRIVNSLEISSSKWTTVLELESEAEFALRLNRLKDRLSNLRHRAVTERDRIVANTPLNDEHIEITLAAMCSGWEKANELRQLFHWFENIVDVQTVNPGEDFMIIGDQNLIWLGSKTAFIQDPALHIPVIGMENKGHELARDEETVFLTLFISKPNIEKSKLLEGIEASISDILDKGFCATAVLCGYNVFYDVFEYEQPDGYLFGDTNVEYAVVANFGGTYKNIPIFYFNNELLQNTVVVADFKKAFTLRQKISDGAYQKVINSSIKEISEEDAKTIWSKDQTFLRDMSESEALIKLMTSVRVDFYVIERFEKNEDAFKILKYPE